MPTPLLPVVLVTGAARGIGLATTRLFLEAGWQVAMLDIDGETLHAAVADLAQPDNTLALVCDVAEPDQVVRAMAELAGHFGRLNAVVNNAGTATFRPIRDISYADWSRVLAVNLTGPFLITQAATPHLIAAGGGAVVNITSISGFRASTLRVAYGVSKAGLAQLTKQQAAELGEFGIRVNAVAPGPVNTAMSLKVHTPDIRAAYHDNIPLNRYGTEPEIGRMILFLCSAQASYITGQIIGVDGGFESTGIGLPALRRGKS
jgi:NAD(P)-dependent dehydrogenase (short-subunit alcohol dehydrogenase family)